MIFFAHWISLGDIGKLDSAICEPVQREQLLRVFRTESFGKRIFVGNYIFTSSLIHWIIVRSVKLQLDELFVNDVLATKWTLLSSLLSLVGPNLKKVTYSNNIKNSCGNDSFDKLTMELSLQCTNLQELRIQAFTDGSVTALLARNPHMKRIQLGSQTQSHILHIVSTLCPTIESIDINCPISVSSFERFMLSVPVLLTCLRFMLSVPDCYVSNPTPPVAAVSPPAGTTPWVVRSYT